MRNQSDKHNKIVENLSNLYGGRRTDNINLKKGMHYPDVILLERDIEVEMLNSSNLRNKCKKYEKGRKRTLVIAIPEEIKWAFDEIILWKD